MSTTRSDLRSQLQTELRDPNDKVWNTASKNQYINTAYFQIQKDNNFVWRWNKTSTTLTTPYTLPTDFVSMDLVTKGTQIVYLADKLDLVQRGTDLTKTGTPTWYYYDDTVITTYPVTTDSLTAYYRKKLTALSSDTDAISFPDDFANAIVKYAKYLAWSSPRGNRDSANEALSDYGQEYATLMGTYGINDQQNLTFGLQQKTGGIRSDVLYN